MNLYSKKQRWKLVLVAFAVLIVGVTLWYSSAIARKVQQEERQKVKLWSEAIRKKADLVRVTNEAFQELAEQERKKVELWLKATEEMQKELSDYSFALSIIQNNKSIPLILTDNENVPITTANLSTQSDDSLLLLIQQWEQENQPIEITFAGNNSQKIYYTNSQKYFELQKRRNELITAFNKDLVENTALVPVVFVADSTNELIAANLSNEEIQSYGGIERLKLKMAAENKPIEVALTDDNIGRVYFLESLTLKQLRFFPVAMLVAIGIFLVVAYFLFSTFRRAEQNQVWVGMAKETAHQLGTPLSSLMAWIELLRVQGVDESSLQEMDKDIHRLNTVTDRFSKIGSETKLEEANFYSVLEKSVAYLQTRVSKKVSFSLVCENKELNTRLNIPLFEWVIENLTKNAVDAMEGVGSIHYLVKEDEGQIVLDVADTGKGIPATKLKTVFEPGFTTKKRGWGLGLSLAKRIVEEHHKGKINVLKSTDKGTTFRIELKKS
ncbi:MAG: HAMP domain-containing histidine kinase [Flavobacteriales bacterium]|jgi:signal transduction histidine kinase|nr:HAMP domain-containing histidine kinase [Flavobacteriales bacterium]